MQDYDVKDLSLAGAGQKKIEWAWRHMPVLGRIAADLVKTRPLSGLKIAISVHVEAKTACLAKVLASGGADVALTGCNPLSTQDDVAAALAAANMKVYCRYGADEAMYRQHLGRALDLRPDLIIDDGGDFAQILHTDRKDLARSLQGGCEETTTGVMRLKSLERDGLLLYPVLAINNARCKHLFDNRFGTGQSVWTAIMAITNLLVAGKTVVVAGFGMCGKGVALRAAGLGARVIVTEIDPVRACEALMEGYEVMTMDEAAGQGDIFVTVTGCRDVIAARHLPQMKDGAILCNAGHFDVEINLPDLARAAKSSAEIRKNVAAYHLPAKTIYVLASGRLVNLAGGDGHPAEIMDMSFALQALGIMYLAGRQERLAPAVYEIPEKIDNQVAMYLLEHLENRIDVLTSEQKDYLEHWNI